MNSNMRISLNDVDYRMIMEKLDQVGDVAQGDIVSKALREASDIVMEKGKSNLSARNKKKTGNLSSSFTRELKRSKKKIHPGFKRPKGNAAHLIDKGTRDRWTKKGQYRGSITGSRFWSDAIISSSDEALNTLMAVIIKEVNKIINR